MTLVVIILIVASFAYTLITPRESTDDNTRVACVGDSITAITGYPNNLQTLLGNASGIGNFGVSGSTVSLSSVLPYPYQNASKEITTFHPIIIIILLGTNDAHADVHPYTGNFTGDYKQLISQLQQLDSHPKIYLAIPPPVYENNINISSSHLSEDIIPKIR